MPSHERLAGPVIANPRAERVRDYSGLTRRSSRVRSRRFLAEGPQAVREALRSPAAVLDVLMTGDAADRHPDLLDLAETAGIRIREITPEALEPISTTVNGQGAVAVCRMLDAELADVLAAAPRTIAVLSNVRDPGNAGAVLRAADASGADAVIFTESSVDPYNPKAVRSTAGSLFHLPVVIGVALEELAARLREAGIAVLAADAHPPVLDLHSLPSGGVDLSRPHAWVFGNEAWGLRPEERGLADAAVAVPIHGRAESLNLATAAAVCLYESARVRTAP